MENVLYSKRWGISIEEAKQLTWNDYVYSNQFTNADGKTPQRWKINGQVKTWKRDPNRIQIPLKYGLYSFAYLCHGKVADSIYMYKITLELIDVELSEERAIEVLKEKGIIKA